MQLLFVEGGVSTPAQMLRQGSGAGQRAREPCTASDLPVNLWTFFGRENPLNPYYKVLNVVTIFIFLIEFVKFQHKEHVWKITKIINIILNVRHQVSRNATIFYNWELGEPFPKVLCCGHFLVVWSSYMWGIYPFLGSVSHVTFWSFYPHNWP